MAFKGLFGGNSGDFKNAADFYGYFNDTVYAVSGPGAYAYFISTYRGADFIDLRDDSGTSGYSISGGLGFVAQMS